MWPADYRCRATQVRLGMGVDGRASVTESASPSWTRVRDTASPSGGSALVRVRAQPTVMPVGPYEFGTVLGWPADYLCRVTPVGTMLGWPADYRCRATQGRLDLGVDVRVTESASPSSRSALVRVRARQRVNGPSSQVQSCVACHYRCRATQVRLGLGVDVRVTESASPSRGSAQARVRA